MKKSRDLPFPAQVVADGAVRLIEHTEWDTSGNNYYNYDNVAVFRGKSIGSLRTAVTARFVTKHTVVLTRCAHDYPIGSRTHETYINRRHNLLHDAGRNHVINMLADYCIQDVRSMLLGDSEDGRCEARAHLQDTWEMLGEEWHMVHPSTAYAKGPENAYVRSAVAITCRVGGYALTRVASPQSSEAAPFPASKDTHPTVMAIAESVASEINLDDAAYALLDCGVELVCAHESEADDPCGVEVEDTDDRVAPVARGWWSVYRQLDLFLEGTTAGDLLREHRFTAAAAESSNRYVEGLLALLKVTYVAYVGKEPTGE
jgi:hypothetical protein